MRRLLTTLYSCALASILFIADRVTKYAAITYCINQCTVHQFVSFEFVLNRGISWGMLHSQNNIIFGAVTAFIIALTAFVGVIIYKKHTQNKIYLGELLIVTGSVSNIIDRILYGGVIDFIALSYKTWTWPVFNIADILIVVGVGLMLIQLYKED